VAALYPLALASTLHQAHDTEEHPDWPRLGLMRIFLFGWDKGSGVIFQFFMAKRARVCVQEVAKVKPTVRTFRDIHFRFLIKDSSGS
jgi:hypothetical protein